jgi:hypothetical protein
MYVRPRVVQFILGLPLPSYGLLGMSAFVAIAFIGCIFQLFCKCFQNVGSLALQCLIGWADCFLGAQI